MSIYRSQRVMNMATDYKDTVGRARIYDRVFSWGANSYGQLANGSKEDQPLPREINNANVKIQTILGGGGHTLAISDNGELWVCGSNSKGQLGLGTTEDMDTLQKVEALSDKVVVQAEGGWDFTAIITLDGELYTTGSNAFGQLGLLEQVNHVKHPVKVQLPKKEKVLDVATGLRHVAIVTEIGDVYCCGAGKKGQLGVVVDSKPPQKLMSPTIVEIPEKIVQVTAGSYHTAALSVSGTVYVWGCNKYGQMTQPPTAVSQINTPTALSLDYFSGKVRHIHSGWTHLLVVIEDGNVYNWGRNDYCQLGRTCDGSCDHIPRPISALKNVRTLACGSEHNLAVTDEGKILSWGWNEHGICGTGDEVNVQFPIQVAELANCKFSLVGCGAGHSFAICDNIT